MNLGNGLEEIGEAPFGQCTSLLDVIVTPVIKVIKRGTSLCCWQLDSAVLGKRLEEIGKGALGECTSLHEIWIPPDVNAIIEAAFHQPSVLSACSWNL